MSRSRVLSVMAGLSVDPPARGEIWVSPAVLESQGLTNDPTGMAELAAGLGWDFCFLSCDGPQAVPNRSDAFPAAVAAVHVRDLACGVVVDGPWQRLASRGDDGLMEALKRLAREENLVQAEVTVQAGLAQQEMAAWTLAGADLILLADDLAYSQGLYFSPAVFHRLLLPLYRQLHLAASGSRVPLGFHSDGDLTSLMPVLVDAGFSFFSLEPEAVGLLGLLRQYAEEAILLSGIPASWLYGGPATPSPAELSASLLSMVGVGRLILTSACGISSIEALSALSNVYRLAEQGEAEA